MKLRALAVFPLVFLVAAYAGLALSGQLAPKAPLLIAAIQAAKLFAAAGALAAALAFDPKDYLRRVWTIEAVAVTCLVLRDVTLRIPPLRAALEGAGVGAPMAHTLLILSNVGSVASAWMLARAARVAGLELPGSRARRWALTGALLVLALAITGPAMLVGAGKLGAGVPTGFVILVSSLADTAGLVLIAPVFFTALALRGGLLQWPWALLTVSRVAWLVYDLAGALPGFVTAPPAALPVIEEAFRILALTYAFSAGMAQRWIVNDTEGD